MVRANNRIAYVAIVGPITDRRQTIHSWASQQGAKRFMAFPDVVLTEGDSASMMPYRYRCDGEFCGDTWHASLEDAQNQAQYEYGEALGQWRRVPPDVADTHQHAIALAQKNRDPSQ